jgi:hypothetical protein
LCLSLLPKAAADRRTPAQAPAARLNGLPVVSGARLIRALERLGWNRPSTPDVTADDLRDKL